MNSNFFDLVLVKFEWDNHNYYVFEAPAFSYIQAGEMVIVEGKNGTEREATVVNRITILRDSEVAKFIIEWANKTDEILKVKAKVIYHYLEYDSEEEDD